MKREIKTNIFTVETVSGFGKYHRKCKKFLLFPKTISGVQRWWETAEWEGIFQDNPFLAHSEDYSIPYDKWVAVKWLDVKWLNDGKEKSSKAMEVIMTIADNLKFWGMYFLILSAICASFAVPILIGNNSFGEIILTILKADAGATFVLGAISGAMYLCKRWL